MEKTFDKRRNLTLDLLKCIFCIFIVMLHSQQILPVPFFYILRSLTALGVPGFFAISGYLFFFHKEYTYKSLFKGTILRYACVFSIWYIVYILLSWSSPDNTFDGFITYAVTNIEGWHLWYIKDCIQILIIYPFIKKITDDERLLKGYSLLWLIFVAFRFTLTVIPQINWIFIRIIQIPLFQLSGYIGGTMAGYYPTEAMGLMIVGGGIIKRLEEVGKTRKNFAISLFLFAMGILMAILMIYYQINIDPVRFDWGLQPFHIYLFIELIGFLGIIYYCVGRYKNSGFETIIHSMANCTMGIYIIHPLVMRYVRQWIGGG